MPNKLKDLSPMNIVAFKTLKNAMNQLLTGQCSEDEIAYTMSKLSPENNGYYNPEDYVSVDEGMRILGFGSNRVGFTAFMKKNNIKCEYFNGRSIGYNRNKIAVLKTKIESEYQERRAKQERKRLRNYKQEKIKFGIDF